MKCPICNKELELRNKKVGETADGEAIYNEFAICHDCKKQWNLDKQRAKKEVEPEPQKPKQKKRPSRPDAASGTEKRVKPSAPVKSDAAAKQTVPAKSDAVAKTAVPAKKKRPAVQDGQAVSPEKKKTVSEKKTLAPTKERAAAEGKAAPKKKISPEDRPVSQKKRPASPNDKTIAIERPSRDTEVPQPKKKQRPVKPAPRAMEDPIEEFSDALDSAFEGKTKPIKRKPIDNRKPEQTYSNIPPKHVRESREKEMRENYQNMLDEGDDEEEGRFPIVLVVILVILILAAAAFAGYWFFLR